MIKVTSHIHLTFIKLGICAGEKGGKKYGQNLTMAVTRCILSTRAI